MSEEKYNEMKKMINGMLDFREDGTKDYLEGHIDCLVENDLITNDEYIKLYSYLKNKVGVNNE